VILQEGSGVAIILTLAKKITSELAEVKYFDVRDILMFVTWILPQLTARSFMSNKSKAGLARV